MVQVWQSFQCLVFFAFLGYSNAQTWTFEIHTGTSLKAPSSLRIQQDGYPDAYIDDVRYETRPWVKFHSLAGLTENYYGIRIGYYPAPLSLETWGVGYEIELLHDKAYYLSGNDPDGVVQHFELSDGLNQIMFNIAGRYPLLSTPEYPNGYLHLIARVGTGPVITGPASVIRGLHSGTRTHQGTEGFYWLAGVGMQASVQARLFISPYVALSTEIKGTVADTNNLIANGIASTTIYSVHFNVGFTLQIEMPLDQGN
jgi:hypothetical protein